MRRNYFKIVFTGSGMAHAGHITLAPTTCALPAERIQTPRETNGARITLAPTTWALAEGRVWIPRMTHVAHITLAPITYALMLTAWHGRVLLI